MWRIYAFIIAVLLASDSAAEVHEVALVELHGSYSGSRSQVVTALLPGIPTLVNGASVRMKGTVTVGHTACLWDSSAADPEPVRIQVTLGPLFFFEDGIDQWVAFFSSIESGQFEVVIPLAGVRHVLDFDFLGDGVGEVRLVADTCTLNHSCWAVDQCSGAVLSEVTLLIDADIPVPVESSTWGHIKALYTQAYTQPD